MNKVFFIGIRMMWGNRDKRYTPERYNLQNSHTAFENNEILHSDMVYLMAQLQDKELPQSCP